MGVGDLLKAHLPANLFLSLFDNGVIYFYDLSTLGTNKVIVVLMTKCVFIEYLIIGGSYLSDQTGLD